MANVVHNLMIYNSDTGKLILAIRLTPLQVMALRPQIIGHHTDDPNLSFSYAVKDCELFLTGTPET